MEMQTRRMFSRNMMIFCVLFSGAVFVFGAYIMTRFSWIIALGYLGFCCALELYIVQRSKGWCYYYGKMYAFGKSWPASFTVEESPPARLSRKNINVLIALLQLLILVIPVTVGAERLWSKFSWFCFSLLAAFIVLYLAATLLLRGPLMKRYIR
jgi:hypothetical protein